MTPNHPLNGDEPSLGGDDRLQTTGQEPRLAGEAALAHLLNLLDSEDESTRQAASRMLGQSDDSRAVEALVSMLHDESRGVRYWAAIALTDLEELALPRLLNELRDEFPEARGYAAWCLGQIARKQVDPAMRTRHARRVLPLLGDPDPFVREHVATALYFMRDTRSIPHLLPLLADPVSYVRSAVASALAQFGEAVLPRLLEALKGEDEITVNAAANSLGLMGEPALPGLIEAASVTDNEIQLLAIILAMRRIGKPAVPSLLQLLENKNARVRRAVLVTFSYIYNLDEDDTLLPVFTRMLRDPDHEVRREAAHSMARRGEKCLPILFKALKDRSRRVRHAAVQGLGSVYQRNREADFCTGFYPHLVERLHDKDDAVQSAAIALLGAMREERAVPGLIQLLHQVWDNLGNELNYDLVGALQDIGTLEALAAVEAWRARLRQD